MAWAEKMASARFFTPEDLERLRMTEDGVVLDSPPRKNTVYRNIVGVFIIGLALFGGSYYYLFEKGLVSHPNVQMQKLVTFVESALLKD